MNLQLLPKSNECKGGDNGCGRRALQHGDQALHAIVQQHLLEDRHKTWIRKESKFDETDVNRE